MRHFTETVKGQKVTIEVLEQAGFNIRYSGYAFCPMKECQDKCKEAFKAEYRSTEGRAKSDAKAAVSKHLSKVHGL